MSEAELERKHGDRAVELRVVPRLENVAVVRTLVGAVGAFEDLDVDTVADLRLAVDEACTQLVRSASPKAMLVVVVEPHDAAVLVHVSAVCETDEVIGAESLSWHVLASLTDEVDTFHHDGQPSHHDGQPSHHDGQPSNERVFGVTMTARRVGSVK